MEHRKSPPHISICFDDKYFPHALTALASVYLNSGPGVIRVSLITNSLTDGLEQEIQAFQWRFNQPIHLLRVAPSLLEGLPTSHHITPAAYLRLLLPILLPEESHTIYLDCDLVVEMDIHDLWDVNLDGFPLAAVPERLPLQDSLKSRLGLVRGPYLNSGVLKLDLNQLRTSDDSAAMISWLTQNREKAILHDQDAINIRFNGNFLALDRKFNINPIHENPREILETMPNRIIHFAGPIKPWFQWYDFFLRQIFWQYAEHAGIRTKIIDVSPVKEAQHLSIGNQNFLKGNYIEAARTYHSILNGRTKLGIERHIHSLGEIAVNLYQTQRPRESCNVFRTALHLINLEVHHTDIYLYKNIL